MDEKQSLERNKKIALGLIIFSAFAFFFLVVPMFYGIEEEKEETRIKKENTPVVHPVIRVLAPAGEKKTINHPYPGPFTSCYTTNIKDKEKITVYSRPRIIDITNRTRKDFHVKIWYFEKLKRLDCKQTWNLINSQNGFKD